MFFPRLRKQVKWMFVFLALAFALGFVVFNVGGAGPSGGIGDLFRNAGGSSGPSVGDAQDKIKKNPKDANAYRELSTALQTRGDLDQAIPPLEQYVKLRPNDQDTKRELAGLYLRRADRYRNEAQSVQLQYQDVLAGLAFSPPGKVGEAVGQDAISREISGLVNDRLTRAFTKSQEAYGKAVGIYKQIAKATPRDPNVQIELAQAAEAAGDTTTALGAYKRFLKLAPDDPSAPQIKLRIRQLQQSTSS
jgi:tetratricopeptide (TPR) repeat protein